MVEMKFVLLVLLNISAIWGKQRLSNCQTTIINCCDPTSRLPLPLRCFELNLCPGLYWAGRQVCSKAVYSKVVGIITKTEPERKTDVSFS